VLGVNKIENKKLNIILMALIKTILT